MHALSIMDVDAPEPVIPRDAARPWLDTSKSVSNLTSISSTNHFQCQIACGNMAPGTNYSLQASNDGALGQSLYMLNNPPSATAQSVIRQNINALSHRQGKTVINLYDDHSVDLRSFGRTSATHSQGNHTGTGLVGDIGCGIEHGNGPSDHSLCPEWEKEMYELFSGDNNEMFQLGMIQSMQASNPYVGDENTHATMPKQSISGGTTSKTRT